MTEVEENAVDRRAELQSRLGMYNRMVEIRQVEERVQALFNENLVRGSTHLCSGQEAVSVGLASVARVTDRVTCTYRGHGMALSLGVTPAQVIGEIVGRQIGCTGGLGGSMHLCDVSVGLYPTFAIVGAGLPVAAGVALAARLRDTDDVAFAVFGDGAANIGAFHETLNLAGIWELPVVFVCENNLYGEYTRIDLSTPVDDLSDRAASYGIPGEVVDGQNVDEVIGAVSGAVRRARAGKGATLLEMKTYRYSGHSRSDPATYRPPGELEQWQSRDPIQILGDRLVEDGLAGHDELTCIAEQVAERVELAVDRVMSSPEPALEEMFRHVSATQLMTDDRT